MSKGKTRKAQQIAKKNRKVNMKESGGKSRYAAKRARSMRGTFGPNSPFHVKDEAIEEGAWKETELRDLAERAIRRERR